MKKALLVMAGLLLAGGVAFAQDSDSHLFGLKDEVLAVGVDAPNLVKFDDWSLGAEATKQMNYTAGDEGYLFLAKVTYSGSLIDFSPKSA